ncbi:MAG: PEP-utilizing enzyme [Candidatus Woesearchaeota archaeon]|nr:PEP-utilizing enzyme [Candidatus Woesearchaeota archaeon]
MAKLQNKNWYHDVPNQRITLYIVSVLLACLKEHDSYYNRKIRNLMFSITDVYSARACYSEPDLREGAQKLLAKCIKNTEFLKKTERIMIERGSQLLNSSRKVETIKDRSIKSLSVLFKEIYDKYARYFAIVMIPELSIEFVEKDFDEEVKSLFGKEANKVIDLLSIPRDSFLLREEKELLAISKKPNFRQLIKEHVKNYFWLNNNYVDTKYLGEGFFLDKLKSLKLTEEHNMNDKKKFLNSLEGGKYKRLKTLANMVEFITFVQDTRKRTAIEASYYINELLDEMRAKKGLSKEEISLLTGQELIQLDTITISGKELIKRKKKIVCYYHDGNYEMRTGDDGCKFEQEIAPFSISGQTTFFGRPAYRGKLRGAVNVILSVKELHKLKDKEILVTSNTTPDYVPFLKKAKAVITEKGGITSHAAIISREMKIPCIVGIKHITLALKTGDEIEVDAYKGVVKIIKRNT